MQPDQMKPDLMEPAVLEETAEPVPVAEEVVPAVPAAEEVSFPPPAPEDVTHRLAEDFLLLTQEFPHILTPTQLPEKVLDLAAGEGISLLDAYLRHRWQEEKRVAAAQQKRQQSAQSTAGSLSRGAAETPPEQDAFLRAFRNAL